MSGPALALTPVPIATGMGEGAATVTPRLTATVITRRVRTRMENRRPGNRGASQALHGPGAPCFPSPSTATATTSIWAGGARD
jgi:hypothetical protein